MAAFKGSPAYCVMTHGALQGTKLSSWPHLTMLAYYTAARVEPAARFRGGQGAQALVSTCTC